MKKFATMGLALAMVLMMGASALAGGLTPINTEASVSFADGSITPGPDPDTDVFPGVSSMAIAFGQREIPGRAETYTADGSDTGEAAPKSGPFTAAVVGVQVADTRNAPTVWTYKVKLGKFTPVSGSPFDVVLNMESATADSNTPGVVMGNSGSGTYALTAFDLSLDTSLSSNETTALQATSVIGRGKHIVKWNNSDISMTLSANNFDAISDQAYTATMTWTLSLV